MKDNQNFMTIQDVAVQLKVTTDNVLKIIKEKKLKAYKPSKRYYIFSEDIINYIKNTKK